MNHNMPSSRNASRSSASIPDDATSQRIVAEARRRFFSLGIRGVTMDDLAYDLGMSKRTLYQYFRTKSELVQAVFLDKFRHVEEDLTRISANSSSDWFGTLHALLACLQSHMEELQPPFVMSIRRDAPAIFAQIDSHRSIMIDRHLGKILREGCTAGIVRTDIPVRVIIEIVLGAVRAIMNPEMLAKLDLTPKEGLVAILTLVLQGAMTESRVAKP